MRTELALTVKFEIVVGTRRARNLGWIFLQDATGAIFFTRCARTRDPFNLRLDARKSGVIGCFISRHKTRAKTGRYVKYCNEMKRLTCARFVVLVFVEEI